MRRLLFTVLIACAGFCISLGDAWADKRVALVIGNSNYRNVPPLPNPARDAAAIAAMFRDSRFDVVEAGQDLNNLDTRRLLREFSDKAQDADIAVVFYAGHGIEIDGVNYLIPTDALLQRDRDAYDEAIALDRVLQTIDAAKTLRLVILDACRDNPFARTMKRNIATRSLGRGLVGIEPATANTLVAYAARGGSTAEDGTGEHSPFTMALLKYLTKPGLDVRKALGFVRDDVMKTTNQQQEPFVYGSLGGSDVSLVPAAVTKTAGADDPGARAEVRHDYEFALQLGTKEAWQSFLAQYPTGFYAELAKAQLGKLAAGNATAAPEVRAPDRASAPNAPGAGTSAPASQSQLASLPPAGAQQTAADIARSLQTELKRVGCFTGSVDGDWQGGSRRSLEQFNKFAGTRFETKLASLDALDAVKSKNARVCPLVCSYGYRANDDHCERIVCKTGYEVGDDNICEKMQSRKPVANRAPARRDSVSNASPSDASSSADQSRRSRPTQPSGQIACDRGGCHPVQKGCHVEPGNSVGFNGLMSSDDRVVCN